MMKPHVVPVSMGLYSQDIKNYIIKGHKYFRTIKQFNEGENVPKRTICALLNKLKRIKTLKSLKLETNSPSGLKTIAQRTRSALKTHCQGLRVLEISTLINKASEKRKSLLSQMKHLVTVSIDSNYSHIKFLPFLRKVESLFINITNDKFECKRLYKALVRLLNLKELCLLVSPSCLDKLVIVLNQFSATLQRPVKFQILTKTDYDYNEISDPSLYMLKKISRLSLKDLNSEIVLRKMFLRGTSSLLTLRSLKLEFSAPELSFTSYLLYLEHIPVLEKLSLSCKECWDVDFAENVIRDLRLPVSLQELKFIMPLSLKKLITKYSANIKDNDEKYPWRKKNFFEEEELFYSFFKTLEGVKCLRKAKFGFQMVETFNSYYSNFLISILNRLPNISSFAFHVTDCTLQEDLTSQISEPFDLALLFQACSAAKHLECLEVYMPNLLFEGANICHTMNNLKKFTLGLNENEEESLFKYQNISKYITGWLRSLIQIAPNLSSLVLDFTEVIDEVSFCKRFMFIERFQQLESFCSRYVIKSCSSETIKKVGRMIQSLQKLNTIALNFEDSDKNVLEIKKYLYYQRSLREVLFTFNPKNTRVKGEETESLDFNMTDDEALSENEDPEFERDDVVLCK